MNINGETQIIVFFGSTYKTSKMYPMYNAGFQALGLNYVYIPTVVNDLEKAVDGVRNLGIKAIGVTVPYKVSIIPYLDALDEQAKRIGAVNVVVNHNGRLIGSNTDGDGCVRALEEATTLQDKHVVLLGSGGAAQAIAFALVDKGAILTIINRTPDAAKELAQRSGATWQPMENLEKAIAETDIIINSTTVGMTPNIDDSLIPQQLLQKKQIVMDIVSNPKETKLLREAKEAGCTVVYGYRMLLHQGVIKFTYYTGVKPPIEAMGKVFV
jgi:shikimate dehydrogenase